jgi:hypothetical protein
METQGIAVANVLEQLAQHNLIDWKPLKGSGGHYMTYMARIKAGGVDVIEGTANPAISISVDNSVSVHGSQGVQIGGQGNVQTVTMDVGHLLNAVDGGAGTQQEKEEAKSLLKKITENPLVKAAFELWAKSHFGK